VPWRRKSDLPRALFLQGERLWREAGRTKEEFLAAVHAANNPPAKKEGDSGMADPYSEGPAASMTMAQAPINGRSTIRAPMAILIGMLQSPLANYQGWHEF
jgi:hypothetical protein